MVCVDILKSSSADRAEAEIRRTIRQQTHTNAAIVVGIVKIEVDSLILILVRFRSRELVYTLC